MRATGSKEGVRGENIAEARRNCRPRMRQAAFKFFANLSAEKRGDLQKYLNAFFDLRHTHTAVKSDAPGRAGRRGAGGGASPLQNSHEPDSSYRKVR